MEKQELERHELQTLDGHIEYVDRTPDLLKSPIPVFISPGWSENPKVFEDAIDSIVTAGRRVVALKYQGDSKSHFGSDLPTIEVNRAVAILDLMGEKNIDKIDIIAHSEGALSAVIAAFLQPEKVRSIVFVDPAGMIGPDTLLRLLGRFSVKLMRDVSASIKNKQRRRMLKEGLKYIQRHPIEGFRGAKAISQSEVGQIVRDLHKLGIRIGIMSGVDDPVFPMKRLQKIVKAGDIDGFLSVRGGHDTIHTHPNYAQVAEGLLTSLENKPNTIVNNNITEETV